MLAPWLLPQQLSVLPPPPEPPPQATPPSSVNPATPAPPSLRKFLRLIERGVRPPSTEPYLSRISSCRLPSGMMSTHLCLFPFMSINQFVLFSQVCETVKWCFVCSHECSHASTH